MATEDNRAREREGGDDEEEKAQRERAKKAFERLKSLSVAMGTREISRTAQRLSRWANPTHMQWKDINKEVTTAMVKEVWPCSDSDIKKGRWKVSKCQHDDIKANAEMIALEVFGHPLHNADAPLYFAKMLFMQFVLQRPVDFSSKEQILTTGDIRASSVTITREELQLALEGANLQLVEEKDILRKSLVAKEQETQRIIQAQTPPQNNARLEQRITQIGANIASMSQRLPSSPSHLMNGVLHPEAVLTPMAAASSSAVNQCPSCRKLFDTWSGYYMLACGHYYHLACLIRLMVLGEHCTLCNVTIPIALYKMFGLALPHTQQHPSTSSVIRDLNFEDLGDNQSQQRP